MSSIVGSTPPTASVIIGTTQNWMLRNLDVTTYRNGDPIPQVTDQTQWNNLTTGAWCYYNNDSANGAVYGKLYNWYALNDSRGLAPKGWHLPTPDDWLTLYNFLGSTGVAGGKMKSTSGWFSGGNGTNSSGFTALPGGYRTTIFENLTNNGYWWRTGTASTVNGYAVWLDYSSNGISVGESPKYTGLSVRVLLD
jgi:uncharacterized protein (TIGR02145 family)